MPTISFRYNENDNEREKCDTRCDVIRWSNSEV